MKSEVTHTPTVVVSPSASVKLSVDCRCSVETEGRIKMPSNWYPRLNPVCLVLQNISKMKGKIFRELHANFDWLWFWKSRNKAIQRMLFKLFYQMSYLCFNILCDVASFR